MTRRLHGCLACTGRTRHRAICGPCRHRGVTIVGDTITITLETRPRAQVRILPAVENPHAPTVAELTAGFDIAAHISSVIFSRATGR